MPRCFMTGIEISLEEGYALDLSEAHRVARELKNKLQAMEKLIEQLGTYDKVELRDRATGKVFIRLDYHLVSATVAQALGMACPERRLFLPYADWKELRRSRVRQLLERKAPPPPDNPENKSNDLETTPPHAVESSTPALGEPRLE